MDEVLQIVRRWLMATGASGGLTDEQVILTAAKGPRPPLPYLAVHLTVGDVPVGADESRLGVGTTGPTVHVVGHRQGTLSIHAYGAEAREWLERAHLQLGNPEVLRQILHDEATGSGVTLVALGGMTDLSMLIDTEIEGRWMREYTVAYDVTGAGDGQDLVEAATISIEQTYRSDAPAGDLHDTITA